MIKYDIRKKYQGESSMSKYCPDCGYNNNDSVSNCVVCNFAFKVSPTSNSTGSSQSSNNASTVNSQSNTNLSNSATINGTGFYRTNDRLWSDGVSATITIILMIVLFFVGGHLYTYYF